MSSRTVSLAVVGLPLLLTLAACNGSGGPVTSNEYADPATDGRFGAVVPLTAAEVNVLVDGAIRAIDGPNIQRMSVAVVDRTGFILASYSREAFAPTNIGDVRDEDNIAVSIARKTSGPRISAKQSECSLANQSRSSVLPV